MILMGHHTLESGGTVYFTNPPTFNYTVKATWEQFESHEKNHHKAYVEYLKNKLLNEHSQ